MPSLFIMLRQVRQRTVVLRYLLSVLGPVEARHLVEVRGQTTLDAHSVPDVNTDDHRVDGDGRRRDHVILHRVDVAAAVGAVFDFASDDACAA